jgi:hypothetical protein
LPSRIRQTLNSEIQKTATHAFRAATSGQHLNSPHLGATYTNHDQTQVCIDVEDEETARWVYQVLHRNLNVAVVPAGEVNDGLTWYSAIVEYPELLLAPEEELRDSIAYANGLLPRHVVLGKGSAYGRRELPNNGYLIYVGLTEDGRNRLREQAFTLRVGALGPAFFYPVEEGEEGPRWHGAPPIPPPPNGWASAPASLQAPSTKSGASGASSPSSSRHQDADDLDPAEGDALELAGMQDDGNKDEENQPLKKPGRPPRKTKKKDEE